jgi:hypothetical protein
MASRVNQLRRLAFSLAYAFALLLAAVWISSALLSLQQPLFDLGRPRIGDAIIGFAGALALSPENTLKLAHMLAGVKLLLGAYLLAAVVSAICERVRWGESGDEMLDLGLFVSAIATIVAASPALADAQVLCAALGELLLCAMASGLSAFGRGWWTPSRIRASCPAP